MSFLEILGYYLKQCFLITIVCSILFIYVGLSICVIISIPIIPSGYAIMVYILFTILIVIGFRYIFAPIIDYLIFKSVTIE